MLEWWVTVDRYVTNIQIKNNKKVIAERISSEKNAELMSAAPEMYKMLKKVLNDSTTTEKRKVQIQKVLDKAEGNDYD